MDGPNLQVSFHLRKKTWPPPLCHRISPAECQPSCAARTEARWERRWVLWRCWWKGPRRPADHWNSMYRPGVWRHKKSDVWE